MPTAPTNDPHEGRDPAAPQGAAGAAGPGPGAKDPARSARQHRAPPADGRHGDSRARHEPADTPAHGRIVTSSFRPAWWLPGPHLQTLWPNVVRRRPRPALRRERLELPDGDFLDLDWTPGTSGPLVLVLHGLEGSVHSHYAAGILQTLHGRGLRAVLMHFRGCSGEPNRLPRGYHSGETGDIAHVVGVLQRRYPETPLAGLGYSLGGNVLLKWLGETGDDNPLRTAVAVSVPFRLDRAADRLEHGASRLYQAHLLRSLRRSIRRKFAGGELDPPLALDELRHLRTFRAFDDAVTAPLHGFADADDYYTRASSRPFLRRIRVPTLLLQAADDPFLTPDALPEESELAPAVTLELSARGGHVGFVAGRWPGRARYWPEERIGEHFEALAD